MKTVTYLKQKPCQRQHQRGAVAIMLVLSLLVLFGFMALVFDLGRTYVVRTELQNAADAAALAGAKDLNGKLSGVTRARLSAQAIGRQNNSRFSFNGNTGIEINESMMHVGKCPDDAARCEWTQASEVTEATAANKTFVRIHIPSGGLATFFAGIAGNTETRTYGLAVAGWFAVQISPIGVCALDLNEGGTRDLTPPDPNLKELTEYGYRRGIAYDLMQLGKLNSGNPYLLNPVDPWTSEGEPCINNHSNAPYAKDFVCAGASTAISYQPDNPDYKFGYAYGNTGYSWGPVRDALNSRFEPDACAPPDANKRQYVYDNIGPGYPQNWISPDPVRQTIKILRHPVTNLPYVPSSLTNQEYGVLWSYSRAVRASGSSPNATPGIPFNLAQWPFLYPVSSPPNLTADASDYLSDTVRPYDTSVETTGGIPDRRVLNIAIVDCGNVTGQENCKSKIPVLGVGKFFMQTKAVNPKNIYAEFDGLVSPIPYFQIRLYR